VNSEEDSAYNDILSNDPDYNKYDPNQETALITEQ
jgi:hypothetical protein